MVVSGCFWLSCSDLFLISAERDLGPVRHDMVEKVPCCSLGRSLVPSFSTRSWLAGTPGAVSVLLSFWIRLESGIPESTSPSGVGKCTQMQHVTEV